VVWLALLLWCRCRVVLLALLLRRGPLLVRRASIYTVFSILFLEQ
jgi:hypothetical protein